MSGRLSRCPFSANLPEAERALRSGVDVVVATPGRLLDHLEKRNVDFSYLETLVLDEADRMLDMGFIPDIERIFQLTPPRRQTLFFSATMAPEIERLFANDRVAYLHLHNAKQGCFSCLVNRA